MDLLEYKYEDETILKIQYPNITYGVFKNLKDVRSDIGVIKILEDILRSIDCSRKLSDMFITSTEHYQYKYNMSFYYYYLLKFENQLLYNKYFYKLINIHKINLELVRSRPKLDENVRKCKKSKTKKYNIYKTKDVFTNEDVYLHENRKTRKITKSNKDNIERKNKRNFEEKFKYMTYKFNKNE